MAQDAAATGRAAPVAAGGLALAATGRFAPAAAGRFAPSPTGPLHAGSLVAALASWLDARARGARWLLRIEDVDAPRCVRGMDRVIIDQLAALGLHADEPPLYQSTRSNAYRQALQTLRERGWVYDCGCTRRDIEAALAAAGTPRERHAQAVYPGTCRDGLHGKPPRAVRLRTRHRGIGPCIAWVDRRLGAMSQHVEHEVGDFVLERADGLWAYQLAVVVDDAWQQVSDVVRGADLADNTARQILLQRALGLPTPSYLHVPLVLGRDGQKLSKQNGAAPLDSSDPLAALRAAGRVLQLPELAADDAASWLRAALPAWAARWISERGLA
ncbi:MAG TPA: tRNA glutamyl-Q(34) synthetase GluQRS [Rubrivivax sp.]|nr:tRNA glutamyl-Q(34) synthetase GluQRS [Rubrivivax sp.]